MKPCAMCKDEPRRITKAGKPDYYCSGCGKIKRREKYEAAKSKHSEPERTPTPKKVSAPAKPARQWTIGASRPQPAGGYHAARMIDPNAPVEPKQPLRRNTSGIKECEVLM